MSGLAGGRAGGTEGLESDEAEDVEGAVTIEREGFRGRAMEQRYLVRALSTKSRHVRSNFPETTPCPVPPRCKMSPIALVFTDRPLRSRSAIIREYPSLFVSACRPFRTVLDIGLIRLFQR